MYHTEHKGGQSGIVTPTTERCYCTLVCSPLTSPLWAIWHNHYNKHTDTHHLQPGNVNYMLAWS